MTVPTKKTKKHRIPFRYFEVIWEDATSNNDSWIHKDEEITPELVCTRGWLVNEKDSFVSLASSVAADDEGDSDLVGNVATIPRGMIKSMRQIKVSTVKQKLIPVVA